MNEKDKLKETLSALLDNEAGKVDQLELRRLVRSLEDYPDLVETYQRYTLARVTINGETVPTTSRLLFSNVRAAIDQEEMDEVLPAPFVTSATWRQQLSLSGRNGLKALGRVAIAASVAVVAVLVVEHQTPTAAPVMTAQTTVATSNNAAHVAELPLEHNNRLFDPNVMTVSAGDRQPFEQPVDHTKNAATGCVISALRADNSTLVWERELPAGYVLCKQSDHGKSCESVAAKIGCYLN
jgi:negative regulator of sigma E activity